MKKTKKKPERLEFYEESHGFASYQRIYYLKEGLKVYRLPELHTPRMEAVILKAQKMYVALAIWTDR